MDSSIVEQLRRAGRGENVLNCLSLEKITTYKTNAKSATVLFANKEKYVHVIS